MRTIKLQISASEKHCAAENGGRCCDMVSKMRCMAFGWKDISMDRDYAYALMRLPECIAAEKEAVNP